MTVPPFVAVMLRLGLGILIGFSCPHAIQAADSAIASGLRQVVQRFHDALERRDVAAISALVADDLVVLENGERNNGWIDFRDNHLIPEMREPAPPSKWEMVRVKEGTDLAWAYTKENLTTQRGEAVVWSVFVLERRAGTWKIVLLDWSVSRPKPRS